MHRFISEINVICFNALTLRSIPDYVTLLLLYNLSIFILNDYFLNELFCGLILYHKTIIKINLQLFPGYFTALKLQNSQISTIQIILGDSDSHIPSVGLRDICVLPES